MATLLRTLCRVYVPRVTHLTRSPIHVHQLRFPNPQPLVSISRFSTQTSTPWAELPAEEREAALLKKLQSELGATDVNIIDRSGGCGTMYQIELTSAKFKGKGLVEQHRMVNKVLEQEIKNMHGLTLKTLAE